MLNDLVVSLDIARRLKEKGWKQVIGYGDYWVSRGGDICRVYKCGKYRFLNPTDDGHGYRIVTLSKNDIQITARLHRLVAGAFIPNPKSKYTVNHINGNKHDNRVCNLEWATASENTRHYHCKIDPRKRGIRRSGKKWRASIKHKGQIIHLGLFKTKAQAYAAFYNAFVNLKGQKPW